MSDAYAVALYGLAGAGLLLAPVRSRRGWRLQLGVLLALTGMWALALGLFLSDDAVGHDCSRPDHSGEWPGLIAAVVWAGVLMAALTWTDPPAARWSWRLGLPLLTAGLIGGTVLMLLMVQSTGC